MKEGKKKKPQEISKVFVKEQERTSTRVVDIWI